MNKKILKTVQMLCGQAYVIQITPEDLKNNKKDELLELGDVFLPNENVKGTRPYRFENFGTVSDRNKRVMTICTMVGCCGSCSFCSVRNTFQRKLTSQEIVGQVEFLLEQGRKHGRCESPMESKDFHVLYTRMGEPSINMDNVIDSIYVLAERYPHIKVGLSTIGWRKGVWKLLDHPELAKHIMMQFSMHGTDEESRSKRLKLPTGYTIMGIPEIAEFVKEFAPLKPARSVSLNFILFRGQKYDFAVLKELFSPDDVYIRLSPLNMTENAYRADLEGLLEEEDVDKKAPLSSHELNLAVQSLKKSGLPYAYAPAIDEEIRYQAACGQALEMLKQNDLQTFPASIRKVA